MNDLGLYELNTIIVADCLDVMSQMPDGCVDLVVADPPFNVEGGQVIKFPHRKSIATKFAWDIFATEDEYISWTSAWIGAATRLLKPAGSLLLWFRAENVSWAKAIYTGKGGLSHKATIVWHKTNPVPRIRKTNYLSSFEVLLWAVVDPQNFTFNFKTQREMHNFIESPICMGNERLSHPSQKPESIIQHFMEIHSDTGDHIFDPFMGSGTTAIVADRLGRKFFGCDINPQYVEMALKRIQQDRQSRAQLELF